MTHAQKTDRTLLYGRWDLYSVQMGAGRTLYRDSMTENIQTLIQVRKADVPGKQLTPEDSLKMVHDFKSKLNDIFKTYMTFDEDGNTTVLEGFEREDDGELFEGNGRYNWLSENQFSQTLGTSKPHVTVVVELTAKKLTIREEEKENEDVTFIKAK
jgi:hypothetical protein